MIGGRGAAGGDEGAGSENRSLPANHANHANGLFDAVRSFTEGREGREEVGKKFYRIRLRGPSAFAGSYCGRVGGQGDAKEDGRMTDRR